ncbi:MAG: glycosyltransferase family 2 protein [Pseudopedobacter saltans]|uniref:Glycosyltransferase family 2 protein n=1 Tax=Pseudopedobacter saltans TaxID=151895 RepID=A0A2W5FBS8_9SPHI|nr:MAG: glycosyltransferase family 2 protein [Pseudopedobacter saltans]
MLSIILVNYYSTDLIMDCLHTVYRETTAIDYEIIIIDNSTDKRGKDKVLEQFPNAKWVDIGYNAGFARANNVGIKVSMGDTVLLLNPDTLILNKAIDNTYKSLSSSQYVACGVQLLNEDGSPQISGNYAMKGGLNYLLPLPYIGNFLKWFGEVVKVKKPNVPNATSTIDIDWINGAFLMVKKSAIDKAGLLDEDFFLYAEEAEWCSRLKKVGKLCIYGSEKIIHLQGETANETFESKGKGYYNLYDKKGLQIMISNFVRIRKEFGIVWFFIVFFVYMIEIPVFLLMGFIENVFRLKNPLNHIKKWTGYTVNMLKVWKYVPIICNNKPYFYKVL